MATKDYYLGLDIGTDSVGYAVTTPDYTLKKFHGEPMWGVQLFDPALPCTERRAFRIGRRRLDRKQQRIQLLRELFAAEINKVDPNFFIRMDKSALYAEDSGELYSLFQDANYTDKEYHKQYPTIHHLILDLMTSTKQHDPRLVYLACAWLIAHRGHFLSDISMDNIESATDFTNVYGALTDSILARTDGSLLLPWSNEKKEELGDILKQKTGITRKHKAVTQLLFGGKAPKYSEDYQLNIDMLLNMLCGKTVTAKDLFGNEDYADVESFSLDTEDEKLTVILEQLGDDGDVLSCAKAVFDWSQLAGTLAGSSSISEAKVKIYEQHQSDLKLLKCMVRKYVPAKYSEIFRSNTKDNYVAYSYHTDDPSVSKTNVENFSKYLKKIIDGIQPQPENSETIQHIQSALEARAFLPKQKTTDNRVIPHQLYQYELETILTNAQKYLPSLVIPDSTGLTKAEKIVSVFTFRIPYYVGPLNSHSPYSWIVRKGEGKILPWNFSALVDEDASEKEFIRRMTNKCTYLPWADVLPQESLLYHRFTVLNEINNIKIDGQSISVETKQAIYTDLFEKRKKVTRKNIEDYLLSRGIMLKGQIVTGIDEQIKSNLKSFHDFNRLLSSGTLTSEQVESIILRRTCTDEKPRFVKWLKKEFPALSASDVKYVASLNYKGFGRLSAEFLAGIEGTDKTAGTGEAYTIISALWNTNLNLMQLLSDNFTFAETIAEMKLEYYADHPRTLSEKLEEMYLPNAVKRPVIRTLDIVKEVVKASGGAPKRIFVEMTRGGTSEQKRTQSRKEQILALYKQCQNEDVRILSKQLEDLGDTADTVLRGDALFLYFMQFGKCAYSGTPIDITKLKRSEYGIYNIEHIYPQALVKDDSIINNRILVLSTLNGQKEDTYPISSAIRTKMAGIWKKWHDIGTISDEKYKRLIRSTPFTNEEKLGFINRQLTETSQSTKAVATLLKEYYPDTEIVYVKARLTSEFRQKFDLLKSRVFNDLHHAKDAYLNIVTGNVYYSKFSPKYGFSVTQKYSIKVKTLFSKPLILGSTIVWDGQKMLEKVKHTVCTHHVHETIYPYQKHHGQNGGFFDQNPLKKNAGLIPLKKDLDPAKYGGYSGSTTASFVLIRYSKGKKHEVMFFPVELLWVCTFFSDVEYARSIITQKLELNNTDSNTIEFPLGLKELKINTVLSIDGFRVCLSSGSLKDGRLEFYPIVPFIESGHIETYLKHLETFLQKVNEANAQKKTHFYDEKYDLVNGQDNLKLFNIYRHKLEVGIFSRRPKANDMLLLINKHQADFQSLPIEKQAYILLQIHSFFGRASGGIDLSAFNESKTACKSRENLKLSNWTKKYRDVRIIDTSASGLWEKQSQNLLELL